MLVSQVAHVFYLEDMKLGNNWHVVERIQPRRLYNIPEKDFENYTNVEEPYQEEKLEEVSRII